MGRLGLQPETELRLEDLDDDELIRRFVKTRRSGDFALAREILGILVFRRLPDLMRRVAIKVPREDVEDVASEAMESALKAKFAGESVGQFVNFLHTIADRRIADFHRRRKSRPTTEPLPEEHENDEAVWGKTPSIEDSTGKVELRSAVDKVLTGMSQTHLRVIALDAFGGFSARETAGMVNEEFGDQLRQPMTEANVHQIASRFRRDLKDEIRDEDEDNDRDDEDGGGPK